MSISTFKRVASGSLLRSLWNRDRAAARRRARRAGFAPAIDQLENRLALSITTPLSIGGTTVGSFTDSPTGPGNIGDFVTVSIEGTRGTVIFNGGAGIIDGNDIQTIDIIDASPDFQLTFNGVIRTANPVPYGSDGIIQIGTITTNSVIRGINTVRGPATNVAVAYTPFGFTQTGGDVGTVNMSLTGDVTSTFVGGAPGTFVVATPLLPSAGTPVFTTVSTSSYTAGTDTTAITLAAATGTGTTAGALTTAEVRNVEFQLTKFVGVNFSNRNLKEGGGLFVDTVLGDGAPAGDNLPANVGIVLSQGLLAYSTIGIRNELQAAVVLGTARSASVDGRMFVESATGESEIYVGGQRDRISKNSAFELTGGGGPFGADVIVAQPFQGVMNLQTAATGSFIFARGVGSRARLNARSWAGVLVNGDFAGQINAPNGGVGGFGNLNLNVTRNLTATARVNVENNLSLIVGGNVAKGATVAVGGDTSLDIGGNFAGSTTSRNLRFFVGGNVSAASRITAQAVTDWQNAGTPNFEIGGRLDGIVNVGVFDAAPNEATVTILGNGAGQGARFNVGRFETDTLVFNGNFRGNLRVLQDLRANLNFGGNVSRITIGGRVGSYDSGNTIVPVTADIVVTGRLLYLNTNSYFQAVVPGVSGVFWNNSIPSATIGSLITGRYVTVVPNLQTQPAPGPTPPQTYTVPTAPTSFTAALNVTDDGIDVSFAAPTSNGNLPVVYYEYTTNALAGTPTWVRFSNLGQGPGSNIALPAPSTGGSFTLGTTYNVSVRAVNALGDGTGATQTPITIPNP
jgi:hypothetical protein